MIVVVLHEKERKEKWNRPYIQLVLPCEVGETFEYLSSSFNSHKSLLTRFYMSVLFSLKGTETKNS